MTPNTETLPNGGRRTVARASAIDRIMNRIEQLTVAGVFRPDGIGPPSIRRWLDRYTVDDLIEGVEESFSMHLRWNGADLDGASIKKSFQKIPSVTQRLIDERTRPWLGRCYYIQGIARRRFSDKSIKIADLIEAAHLAGNGLDTLESDVRLLPSLDWVVSILEARRDGEMDDGAGDEG